MPKLTNDSFKRTQHSVADLSAIERFDVQDEVGLTESQVNLRLEQGLVNENNLKKGKSILQIIAGNVFTFFNAIYFVIALILCLYGQYQNCTFLPVVIINTVIAIAQEIKSKTALDKLNIISEPTVTVVRNGTKQEIAVSQLVLDDVVHIAIGAQISADCIVTEGFVEVNESILTGESEAVTKHKGDKLFAGSYVVGGSCVAHVDAVGKFNYVQGLTNRAKVYSKPRSEMLKSLKIILVVVAILVVPMAVCLWIVNSNYYAGTVISPIGTQISQLIDILNKTTGSIITMIPAGPFLLTSIALAQSFITLAGKKTLAQELYCIEMLARVDTLCLDKTGTITNGNMKVLECIDLRHTISTLTIRDIMCSYNVALHADNATSKALRRFFGSPKVAPLTAVATVPFNSDRKLSAVAFKGEGTYILGAPEFVLNAPNQRINDLVDKYSKQGYRVLLLTHSPTTIYDDTHNLPSVRRPVALIVVEDKIREDAEQTISWFVNNGVNVKVISGDNPQTVSNIALRVGIENADKFVSLEGKTDEEIAEIADEYTVFGRVSPEQKAVLVRALKSNGHTVAMTGDGVNDILAMKQSDCSISLASGSDAARNVSHLVLMEDNFSAMPEVVAEGRRVVNNIQNATSMYFMKTVYVIVINLFLIVMHFGFGKTMASPLENIQVTLMDWVVVALSTFVLALQPNTNRIEGRFMPNVLRKCLPSSLVFVLGTLSLYLLQAIFPDVVTDSALGTLVTLTYTFGGLIALYYACKPLNTWRTILYVAVWIIVLVCVIFFPDVFSYVALQREQVLLLLVEVLALPILFVISNKIFGRD